MTRLSSRLGSACACLGLGLLGTIVLDARAAHDLAGFLAAHPGVRVGAVHLRPLAGEWVADRVVAGRLTIGRLHLPLPRLADLLAPSAARADAAAPTAPADTNTITADDVTFTSGTATYRFKTIQLAGTNLTKDDLAALVDAKASDGLEARLAKITAKAVVIPEILIDDPTRGSERHALIRQVALANVVAGKASAATAAEMSLALTAGQDAANVASGPIEAANVDLARLAHVLLTRRSDDAEELKPLFDKVVVTKLALSNPTRSAGIEVGAVAATGVRARPLSASLAEAAAAPESRAASALFLADLAQSLEVGTLDVDDFSSHGTSGDGDTAMQAKQIGLQGFGAGKIGGLHLRGFHLDGANAKLGIGSADVGAFAMPQPGADVRVAARPGTLDLGQITAEVAAPHDKEGATGNPLKLTIDHFALTQAGGPSAIPASGSASVQNLGFDLAPDGVLTHALSDMGYRHATVSGAFTSTYDAGAQELTIHKLSLDEPAMGSLELTLRLANVSPDVLSTDPEAAQASAIAVLAKTLDFKVTNAGLFQKAIALKAQQDGISVADERAFGIDFFQNKLPTLLGEGKGIKTIGGAMAKFIADPKTLHVSFGSKEGLGVGAIAMLGDPGALLDSLDIQASANN